jgi:hypothetical protein
MAKPTPTEVQTRFQLLPQDLRAAIFSVDTADAIQAISRKYKLTIEAMGQLADEVGYLMLGFAKPENFIGNLQKRLGIDFETARGITEDLNIQIFARVRNSLNRAHVIEEELVVPVPKAPSAGIGGAQPPQTPATPATLVSPPRPSTPPTPSPFESKLQEKVFSVNKELAEAQRQSRYPGNADPYREPIK